MRFVRNISLIDVMIAVAVILICARYIWAKELLNYEDRALTYLGLPIYSKYFLTVPLVALFFYGVYKKESVKEKYKSTPVIRKSVLLLSLTLLFVAALLLIFTAGNSA